MLCSEILYRILEQTRNNNISDDNSTPLELIYNQIVGYRSKLIRQEQSAGKRLSAMYLQSLPNVELRLADKHDVCGPIEDCILRSVNALPKAVDTALNDLIGYVGSNEGERFERTTWGASKYITASKFTGQKPKFYFIGDYLYVINPSSKLLKYVTCVGVWEDPKAANSFQQCGNTYECLSYDFEFPCSATIVDTIIQLVVQEMKLTKIAPSDTINNTKDDNN